MKHIIFLAVLMFGLSASALSDVDPNMFESDGLAPTDPDHLANVGNFTDASNGVEPDCKPCGQRGQTKRSRFDFIKKTPESISGSEKGGTGVD